MSGNLGVKLNEAFAAPKSAERDYVSPGFSYIDFSHAFPHRILGDKENHPWVFLRREIGHGWYVDERNPLMGFASVDESSVLHTLALTIPNAEALEIGCHRGWSTAHLAAGVKTLDVVDPVLVDAGHCADVEASLGRAQVKDKVTLYGAPSPAIVNDLLKQRGRPWSFIFVDGDHEPDGPLWDAQTVANCAARDAIIVFHDLASPVVAEGLAYLRSLGWSCMVYQTMQIMGVAWRGDVKLPVHIPDPEEKWALPDHLRTFLVSGETPAAYSARLQNFFLDFTSHDHFARARAPLPMGLPTRDALPTDVRSLQEQLRAKHSEQSSAKWDSIIAELSALLTKERLRADHFSSELDEERTRSKDLATNGQLAEELASRRAAELEKRHAEYQATLNQLQRANEELTGVQTEYEAARNQLQRANEELAGVQTEYEKVKSELNDRSVQLQLSLTNGRAESERRSELETLLQSRRFLFQRLLKRLAGG
jgi:archaellum component FlaC